MIEINVEIKNLNTLTDRFKRYPEISTPILQKAVNAASVYLGKYSVRGVVPWKSGNLMHSFRLNIGDLQAEWTPTAYYAIFVNNGTIKQRANPFMQRVRDLAKPEIDKVFENALEKITKEIMQ